MSKGSLFWANARGKLGESVFYRAGGEQRNRTYVAKIKNPKTLAQAEQRLSMLNFSSGFRALRSLLAFSFPNRPSNQSGFNAFVKANKSAAFPVIDRAASDEGLAVLGDALVSQGTITAYGTPVIQRGFTSESEGEEAGIGFNIPFPVDGDGSKVSALMTLALEAPRNQIQLDTPEKFKQVMSILDIPADCVVTVVRGTYEDEGYRYEVGSMSSTGVTGSLPVGVSLISDNFQGEDTMPVLPGSPLMLGVMVQSETSDESYYTVVLSFKQGNKLDVTNSRLIPVGSDLEYTNQFRKGGEVYEQIMANYAPTRGNILSV